jgi:hypothetical protein
MLFQNINNFLKVFLKIVREVRISFQRLIHEPSNYKDTKPSMLSLLFNRVYSLEIQAVMLVFLAPLVNWRPSNLLTGWPPPSPSCVNKYRGIDNYLLFTQCVIGGGGGMGWDQVVWRASTGVVHCVF